MRKSPRSTPALAATLALLLAASAPLDASASRGPQSQQQSRQSQQQTLPDDDDDDDDDERDDGATLPAPEATPPREIIIDAPPGARVDVHDRDGVIEVLIDESASSSPSPSLPQPAPAAAAAAAPPVTPTAPPLADAPTQPPPAMVTVRLSAPERMNLERWVDGAWQRLCASPCQHLVPQGAELRVTPAAGKRSRAPASRVFHAPHDRRAIHLTVRPGDREQRAGGVGLALISAGGIASGLLMVDATARFEDRDRRSYEGFIVLGLASLTFLTGVAMAATGRTQVRELKSGRRLALIPGGAAF
jgi:hypothetical protein